MTWIVRCWGSGRGRGAYVHRDALLSASGLSVLCDRLTTVQREARRFDDRALAKRYADRFCEHFDADSRNARPVRVVRLVRRCRGPECRELRGRIQRALERLGAAQGSDFDATLCDILQGAAQ
jgi:hypothetical protein